MPHKAVIIVYCASFKATPLRAATVLLTHACLQVYWDGSGLVLDVKVLSIFTPFDVNALVAVGQVSSFPAKFSPILAILFSNTYV